MLAVQRVAASGIKKLVAIPTSVQQQLPTNLTQIDIKLKALNITLTPFIYALITSLAKCGNQSESEIYWYVRLFTFTTDDLAFSYFYLGGTIVQLS